MSTENTLEATAQAEIPKSLIDAAEASIRALLSILPHENEFIGASVYARVWSDGAHFLVNDGKPKYALAEAVADGIDAASPERIREGKLARAAQLRAEAAKLEQEAAK